MEKVKLGISPINWCNDDLRNIGQHITLEQSLTEMKEAGYTGTELGHRFPSDVTKMKELLSHYDLKLASAWHSTFFVEESLDKEISSLEKKLDFLLAVGSDCINIAECSRTVHTNQSVALREKPVLDNKEKIALMKCLDVAGSLCASKGIKMCYHHHMGTVIQNLNEINFLLENTNPDRVRICFDTGHLLYAGIDPIWFYTKYYDRISHIHLKDIRKSIFSSKVYETSFLDSVLTGIFTVPGDGMIPFTNLFRLIQKHKYQGWLIIEAEQDPLKANPFDHAKNSFEYINKNWKN
ncbi:MAG: myo-inosose-2 dehydratase [Zetaproteobacteria bacterium]|nr:myo-inosose-2 dehydratase [Pseudobdellovibrionaceae bacterium]